MTQPESNGGTAAANIIFERPQLDDGKAIHELVKRSPPLDLNSSYSYFLLCAHHARTCVVARQGGQLVGFLSAYCLPDNRQTLFIWQVVVDKRLRGQGVAGHMLKTLLARIGCAEARFIETTVSPSNHASRQLFKRFAESRHAELHESLFLGEAQFGSEAHEEERLLRIGPLHP